MKKRNYRLQALIEMRAQAQQEAMRLVTLRRAQLATAEAEWQRGVEAVNACRTQQTSAQQRMLTATSGGIAAQHLMSYRTHLSELRRQETELLEELKAKQLLVNRAETALAQAEESLLAAARELQMVEKHRAAWQTRKRREDEQREQKLQDEMGAVLYRLQKKRT